MSVAAMGRNEPFVPHLQKGSPLSRSTARSARSEFLYTLRLASGQTLLAHVPSHHNHAVGEWVGIRAELDHVVTFAREAV